MQVRTCWLQWREAASLLLQAQHQADQLQEQLEERQALLAELDAAALDDPDELRLLTAEQDRLVHGVRLQEGLAQLIGRLQDGADQAPSAIDHLLACCHELQHMQQLDGSLQPLNDRCLDLEAGLRDLIRDLEVYGASLESDPARLSELQDRLALLKRLERRHGQDLAALCDLRDQLHEQMVEGGAAEALEQLTAAEAEACGARDQANQTLTAVREQVAHQLEQTLLDHLRPMGLANVRFQVAITPCDPSDHGADAVSFLFPPTQASRWLPLRRWPPGVRCRGFCWR